MSSNPPYLTFCSLIPFVDFVGHRMLKNLLDVCGAALAFYATGYAFAYGSRENTHSTSTSDRTSFLGSEISSCQETILNQHSSFSNLHSVQHRPRLWLGH